MTPGTACSTGSTTWATAMAARAQLLAPSAQGRAQPRAGRSRERCPRTSEPPMTPEIEVAWIAGGSGLLGVLVGVTGTVIVGVAGFRNTRGATEKTVDAAHNERVWD